MRRPLREEVDRLRGGNELGIDELTDRFYAVREERNRLKWAMEKAVKQLEEIVCTASPDEGVILLSSESPTQYDEALKANVYLHENFSPLGDALIALHGTLTSVPALPPSPPSAKEAGA